MSFDDYIFVTPSFLRGAAMSLDFGGALAREAVMVSRSAAEADRRAILSDFRVVGRDLHAALESVEKEMKSARR